MSVADGLVAHAQRLRETRSPVKRFNPLSTKDLPRGRILIQNEVILSFVFARIHVLQYAPNNQTVCVFTTRLRTSRCLWPGWSVFV